MTKKDITSMRSTLEWFQSRGEALNIAGQVDPIYEISGLQKALDDGPALLFENIKGYPGVRNAGNVFSRRQRVAAMFDLPDPGKLKFKCLEAMRNPVPARVVEDAPCQEVVTRGDIDVMATLPIIKHSEGDAGRILGGGVFLTMPPYIRKGNDLSFKRMHFRGKDWASLNIGRFSHLGHVVNIERRGEKIPMAICIGTPPSVSMVAATAFIHALVPYGSDELGIAGALQGSPVEICRAKTVDSYVLARSEWVIEGYCLPEMVYESEEAERRGEGSDVPFFPEWHRYMGKAGKHFKFQATAITHRKDRPIFYTPLADSFELDNMNNPLFEACFYDLAERVNPGLVVDVNILPSFMVNCGVVFQVSKKSKADEGALRNFLQIALAAAHQRLAVAVDEDIDIYSTDDVMWAVLTRASSETGIFKGFSGPPSEATTPGVIAGLIPAGEYGGGIGIDATLKFEQKESFKRARYPVDRVDLGRWLSPEQIASVQARQSEYARTLARMGG